MLFAFSLILADVVSLKNNVEDVAEAIDHMRGEAFHTGTADVAVVETDGGNAGKADRNETCRAVLDKFFVFLQKGLAFFSLNVIK